MKHFPEKAAEIISMAAMSSATPAPVWVCEYCGNKNSSNFCSGCGSKRRKTHQ